MQIFKAVKEISFRDALLVSGLALIGVGLYLFSPWISFTVCGAIIFAGGFFMKAK